MTQMCAYCGMETQAGFLFCPFCRMLLIQYAACDGDGRRDFSAMLDGVCAELEYLSWGKYLKRLEKLEQILSGLDGELLELLQQSKKLERN